MKLFRTTPLLIAVAFGLISIMSCKTDFEDIKYNDGSADFSRVVVVGGSHLAGYSDHALYLEAQSNSIPAILATRFAFAGGGALLQPLVNPGVGIGVSGNAKFVLKQVADPCQTGTYLSAQPIVANGDITNYNWLGNQFSYNNLAVPDARICDLTRQSFGDPSPFLGNPFYARFASQPGTSTVSGDALSLNPTFVIVWIGMEDVYNYARTGGNEGGDSITAATVFNSKFTNLINELTSLNAKGVVLNIPGPSTIPFFTEVPYNGLQLTAVEAADLNALYEVVDSTISFTAGANPYVIEDAASPTGRRLIRNGEYILNSIPHDSINCKGLGTTIPISGEYVLDEDETTDILSAINAYNSLMAAVAGNHGLAVCNMNASFAKLTKGVLFNGVSYSSKYLYGGVFSTDGFHTSQRGSALLANEIVNTINSFYSAKIPQADVNSFAGIVFP